MPELPEVENIISDLNKKIKGDMIADFWSDWPKAIKGKSLEAFRKEIKGRKILGARRLGKNIFVDLSGGKTIYIHLKMTGHLLIKSKIKNQKSKLRNDYFSDRVNHYVHHIWTLKSGKKSPSLPLLQSGKINNTLEFSDLRKFGKIMLADTDKI